MSLPRFVAAPAARLRHLLCRTTRHPLIPAAALLAGTLGAVAPALADPAPSALVRTAALQRGVLTRHATAVGTVRTASGGTLSVDFARPVRVLRVLVRPGQGVRRGQALLEVGNAPAADAAYAQAREALRFAKAELGRLLQLQRQQLATQSQVDAARRNLADARATLAAQQAQGLDQARQIVRAPFDGLVQSLQATPGLQLAAGVVALSLAPHAGLQAVVGVDPRQAAELAPGTVARLASVFDPTRSVQATLPLHSWKGWLVPRQAVLRDADGQAYVFQDDHGHARRVSVRVRGDEGERSAISGPLRPSLPLVVLGNYELKDGMALRTSAEGSAEQAR